jgi:predicted nucleic acid-binding protein
MNYLLDVNVLVAWGWSDHVDHLRTVTWLRAILGKRSDRILTSAIPELGFVRVSVQRGDGRVRLEDAVATLESMVKTLGSRHRFLPDDLSSTLPFPTWCEGASRSTDAHLLRLAERNGLLLATLDGAIPGAFLIPPLVSKR